MIFHYAFLVDIDFIPDEQVQVMTFSFTNRILKLKGYGLDILLERFRTHAVEKITVVDSRYKQLIPTVWFIQDATTEKL